MEISTFISTCNSCLYNRIVLNSVLLHLQTGDGKSHLISVQQLALYVACVKSLLWRMLVNF